MKRWSGEWYFGWRWSPRLWYWEIWYDGRHRVIQLIFLQIEYHDFGPYDNVS